MYLSDPVCGYCFASVAFVCFLASDFFRYHGFKTYWMETEDGFYMEQQFSRPRFSLIKKPPSKLWVPLMLSIKKKKVWLNDATWSRSSSWQKKNWWKKTDFNLEKSRQGPYPQQCGRDLDGSGCGLFLFLSLSSYLPLLLHSLISLLLNKAASSTA